MKALFKQEIEQYTGEKVKSLKLYKDPFCDAYASRITMESGETWDALFTKCTSTVCPTTSESGYDLEEVEYDTWPPKANPNNLQIL